MVNDARQDFDETVAMVAELAYELDIEGDSDLPNLLSDVLPAMVDAMLEQQREAILAEFLRRDPNNASKMRGYLER